MTDRNLVDRRWINVAFEKGSGIQEISGRNPKASKTVLFQPLDFSNTEMFLGNNQSYIDLARDKSEALDNIYSLLRHNIKSCNAKRRIERWKTTIGLISEKATFYVQHTFFVHFFAVVLHDYNVKLSETSWLHVLWRKCRKCSWSLCFPCRSFSPWWPLAFLIFSPPPQNFVLFL